MHDRESECGSRSNEIPPAGVLSRVRVALGLLAGLRRHDFRAARTLAHMNFAGHSFVGRLGRFVAVGMLLAGMVVAGTAAAQEATGGGEEREITVSDGESLVRCSSAGKGALVSITRGEEGANLLAPEGDLWVIELTDGTVRSSQADSFSIQGNQRGAVLVWRFKALKLTVRVGLGALPDAQGVSAQWSAQSTDPDGLRVKDIQFPILRASQDITKVTSPWFGRDVFRSADRQCGGLYPGYRAAVQFFAAWGAGGDGLYVGAHDGQGYTKTLLWDDRAVTFTFHQPDPQEPRKEVALPYPVVLAAFEGDWQDGADYYRNWAHNDAPWCQRGTLAQIGPKWARQSTASFYGIVDFPVPLEELAPRLREVFGIKGPIGVHALYPGVHDHSVMPAGKPENWLLQLKLRQLPLMREHGYYVFEYRNSHKYTEGLTGYDEAKPYAARWNGKLYKGGSCWGGAGFRSRYVPAGTPGSVTKGVGKDAYGVLTHPRLKKYPLVEMCMGTSYWQDKLVESVAPCPAYGLIGNYIDQLGYNPNNASRCDAPNHGHPLRGGNWYVRSHEEVLHRINQLYKNAGVERPFLSHEWLSEPLIGLVNASLVDWDIRLLSYLYHPYIMFESHNIYGWKNPDMARLREELAHDFHSGRMPGLQAPVSLPGVDLDAVLRDPNDPADQPALVMMRQWFGVRAAWLDYLNLGMMLHAPKVSAESGRIMASAWRNPDNGIALFFSNATGEAQRLVFDPASYPVRAGWRAWMNNRQEVKEPVLGKGGAVILELAPDETFILEAAAGSSGS